MNGRGAGLVLHHLFERDELPATLEAIPNNVRLEPKRVTIAFESMEDLAAGLLALSAALEEPEEFARFENRYVPRHPVVVDDKDRHEMQRLFADLEELERKRTTKR